MKPLALFESTKIKNAANRFDRSTFTSDQSSIIIRRNSHAELHDLSPVGMLSDLNHIGVADQRFHDFFDSFLHLSESIESIESDGSIEVYRVYRVDSDRLDRLTRLDRLLDGFRLSRIVLDQAGYSFCRLCTNADPILNSIMLQTYFSRINHRIVSSKIFEVLTIPFRTFFLNDKAVEGLTLRADPH